MPTGSPRGQTLTRCASGCGGAGRTGGEKPHQCLGPLDGRDIRLLNTKFLTSDVTDNDRIEVLRFASLLALPDHQRAAVLNSADPSNADIRATKKETAP